jgi:hypothetical protein
MAKLAIVTKAAPVKAPRKPAKPRTSPSMARWQRRAACASFGVSGVLTALSLVDQTHGIHLVTGIGHAQAAALAIGIDVNFIALEAASLVCPEPLRPSLERYARPAIIGAMALSAALNAVTFSEHAQGFYWYAAAALGCLIPLAIYAGVRTGSVLILRRGA